LKAAGPRSLPRHYLACKVELLMNIGLIYNEDSLTDRVMQRATYCTRCKANTRIADATYVRLANARAVIKGKCSICGLEVIKASIMPKSAALTSIRKKRRKKAKRMPIP
jgi:Domain of unknown function (DUF5679)